MPPFKSGDIVLVRLFSGEMIVGKFEEPTITGTKPKLLRARSVMLAQSHQNGPINVGLVPIGAPLFDTVDAATMIYPEATVMLAKIAGKELANAYISNTSGIALPVGKLPGLGG